MKKVKAFDTYGGFRSINNAFNCESNSEVLIHSNGSLKFIWMNSTEAASYLRISVKTLMNLSSSGQIPFYKFGRRNRYRKDELDAILLENKRGK
jgi:excisionase family DNA binding protein